MRKNSLCSKHGLAPHFLATYDTEQRRIDQWRCCKCSAEATDKQRKGKKKWAVAYKGGRCQCCGYDKCMQAMDFHHLDPSTKDYHFAKYRSISCERLAKELDKCILVCANCHREIHAGVRVPPGINVERSSTAEPHAVTV